MDGPELPIGPLSLVTSVTVSKEPIAVEMNPVGAWAEMSLLLPTTRGRAPLFGGIGRCGAALHATSRHSLPGYEAWKHPFFGSGTCANDTRQSSRSRNSSGDRFSFEGACAQIGTQAIHANPTHSNHSRTVLFMDPPLRFPLPTGRHVLL